MLAVSLPTLFRFASLEVGFDEPSLCFYCHYVAINPSVRNAANADSGDADGSTQDCGIDLNHGAASTSNEV